jgi:hypothetical protein
MTRNRSKYMKVEEEEELIKGHGRRLSSRHLYKLGVE